MNNVFKVVGALLLVLTLVFYFFIYPLTPILSGYAARMTCTCHFTQGRSVDDIKKSDLSFSLLPYISSTISESEKSVSSSFFGFSKRLAVFRKGIGCVLLKEEDNHHITFDSEPVVDTFQWKNSSRLTAENKMHLDSLIFDGENGDVKKTRSCLIIYKDSIIYEKYINGFDKDTPQLGWSMTKSITGTLIGMLIKDGKLKLTDNQLYDSWEGKKAEITLEQMLNMTSGIEWEEDYTKVSSATSMLYNSENMVDLAIKLPLEANPGEKYEYSSGTSNLLSGILRKQFDDTKEYLNFPIERLFRPLGMKSAFIEIDESGNYIGSSFMYATMRDWAKYGLLYLHQGNWQGNQLLDTTWVAHTFKADPLSNGTYGTQFWNNESKIQLPSCPDDIIFADGFQGQRVYIIPSKDLVIVRLGLSNIDFDTMVSTIIDMVDEK